MKDPFDNYVDLEEDNNDPFNGNAYQNTENTGGQEDNQYSVKDLFGISDVNEDFDLGFDDAQTTDIIPETPYPNNSINDYNSYQQNEIHDTIISPQINEDVLDELVEITAQVAQFTGIIAENHVEAMQANKDIIEVFETFNEAQRLNKEASGIEVTASAIMAVLNESTTEISNMITNALNNQDKMMEGLKDINNRLVEVENKTNTLKDEIAERNSKVDSIMKHIGNTFNI